MRTLDLGVSNPLFTNQKGLAVVTKEDSNGKRKGVFYSNNDICLVDDGFTITSSKDEVWLRCVFLGTIKHMFPDEEFEIIEIKS